MGSLSTEWRRVPPVAKSSWVAFPVLCVLTIAAAAVLNAPGHKSLGFLLIPGFVDTLLVGILILFNISGTADALLRLQRALPPVLLKTSLAKPSDLLNRFIALVAVLLGFVGAVIFPIWG